MGEYADLQIREDIKRMYGFDPGDMGDTSRKPKINQPRVKCKICGASIKAVGLTDHMRDKHGVLK